MAYNGVKSKNNRKKNKIPQITKRYCAAGSVIDLIIITKFHLKE